MITQYSRLSDHNCPDETATVVNGKWICNCPKRSEEETPKSEFVIVRKRLEYWGLDWSGYILERLPKEDGK